MIFRHVQIKMAKDISSLVGVPFEMIHGGYSNDSSGKSRAMHNTKIFITNMMSICRFVNACVCISLCCGVIPSKRCHVGVKFTTCFRHLEMLLCNVYLSAYGGTPDDVKFIIRATPRIEVNTVEEICQLLDAGVVSFDNAMHLSNMILCIDLQQGIGERANAGQFSRAFMTPSNKKDLIVAEKAGQNKSKPK
jgi:hypothetical protein